jgi:hypothetical protein
VLDQLIQLWRRLLFYVRRNQFDRELEEEINFHLETKAKEHLAAGMSPEGAHVRNLRKRQRKIRAILQSKAYLDALGWR